MQCYGCTQSGYVDIVRFDVKGSVKIGAGVLVPNVPQLARNPVVVSELTLNQQISTINPTTSYTVPSGTPGQAGLYRITVNLVTRSMGTGTCTATITTNNGLNQILDGPTSPINLATGSEVDATYIGYLDRGSTIRYATTYNATSGAYALVLFVEYLGSGF